MSYLGPEANFRLLFKELLENKEHYDSHGFITEVSGKESSFQADPASWLMNGIEDYQREMTFFRTHCALCNTGISKLTWSAVQQVGKSQRGYQLVFTVSCNSNNARKKPLHRQGAQWLTAVAFMFGDPSSNSANHQTSSACLGIIYGL